MKASENFMHQHTWHPLALRGTQEAVGWPPRPAERLWLCRCVSILADGRQCGAFEERAESELEQREERVA